MAKRRNTGLIWVAVVGAAAVVAIPVTWFLVDANKRAKNKAKAKASGGGTPQQSSEAKTSEAGLNVGAVQQQPQPAPAPQAALPPAIQQQKAPGQTGSLNPSKPEVDKAPTTLGFGRVSS